jgi:ABC-type transporter Mla MlaB component
MHLLSANGKEPMLRITTQKRRGKTVLSIEGRLAGPLVSTLEQCWRELRGASPEEKLHLNLCGVSFIDGAGKMLLKEIHRQGGELIAEGCLNQAIVDDIVKSEKETKSHSRKDRPKGSHIVFYIALFSLLLNAATLRAQSTAKAQTLPATSPTEALRLTLDQAVALALKQNPTAQIAILTAAQG